MYQPGPDTLSFYFVVEYPMKQSLHSFRIVIAVSAILFLVLFYSKYPGINTLLIAAYSAGLLLFLKKESFSKTFYVLLGGMFLSSVAVIFGHSPYSVFIFWICLLLFLGNFAYVQLLHLQFGLPVMLNAVIRVPATFFRKITAGRHTSRINYQSAMQFVLLPVITIVVLMVIYSVANDAFGKSVNQLLNKIGNIFSYISFSRILFALLGALIFTLCFVEAVSHKLIDKDRSVSFGLVRVRVKSMFRTLNRLLLRKQQVAIALFVVLNLMIAWLNFLDIRHIWFGFTWNGGYLKMMVHEGTYLLITAILISMAISLYYLRGNIVFLQNNRLFNALIILWLAQNMLMVVSVVLRNNYYVEYFALAHKRIFVYFFLGLCAIGLVTIMIKIARRKTISFLLSVNSVAVYAMLILSACFNWDTIIARYNFNHYDQSLVHYDYLLYLNDAALPYLEKSDTELNMIDSVQAQRFGFVKPGAYLDLGYSNAIESRIAGFKKKWETQSWLEWNYPEYKAYQMISEEKKPLAIGD